jgi:UDP-N-acetylmuramoyl-tripeptide--D-alanyl-D-alanine ligase
MLFEERRGRRPLPLASCLLPLASCLLPLASCLLFLVSKGGINLESITLDFIVNAVNGSLQGQCKENLIKEVCTDTRKISEGCLFIALKGEKYDGHDFIVEAFKKGAAAVISEKHITHPDGAVITVESTKTALLKLACAYRQNFNIPVVGITGSVGKTSTKEMVYAALSCKYKTHKNEGNLNNEIGMPMSAFGLDKSFKAAIFEMGMSNFGEISRLTQVAKPSVGIITNIGISHIEKLGTQQGILKAKLEILDGMDENSILILNGDDKLLFDKIPEIKHKIITYGINNTECNVVGKNIKQQDYSTSFDIEYQHTNTQTVIPTLGVHNAYNALAAFAAGIHIGMAPREVSEGLAAYKTYGMRQKFVNYKGVTIIEDCYNASPDSMNAAFDVLMAIKNDGAKFAVLADMLELGNHTEQSHINVGKAAAKKGVDILLAYGDNAKHYCEGFTIENPNKSANCLYFKDKQELAEFIRNIMNSGDTLLFKGSRGMKLEEVLAKLYKRTT